jgi:O6-methylguanine-DNA--protein-cysteine methyltransferase
VVFDNHADVGRLHEAIQGRRGSRAAREHIAAAKTAVTEYFAHRPVPECTIDWDSLEGVPTLLAAMAVPPAQDRSYDALDTPEGAEDRGRVLGANPVAILVPCHPFTRVREVPAEYVGGDAQRRALREFERA